MRAYYNAPRAVRRLAPTQAATAAVYRDDEQLAYGVVANVSERGACIVTNNRLAPGVDVYLKLSFYNYPDLFETSAQVVWTREGARGDEGLGEFRLHGMKFVLTHRTHRARLQQVLESQSFQTVSVPPPTEFDRLQSSLSTELEKLADKMVDKVGGKSS